MTSDTVKRKLTLYVVTRIKLGRFVLFRTILTGQNESAVDLPNLLNY